ncbi:hypothetical protein CBS101457_002363 [Exobasidium rhododendri]|nr:hypothetical protein CBS101457_002363 [Exobasidium rhododendri]
MKVFNTILAIPALALLSTVAAQADDTPDLTIQTTFPNDAFSRVSNGQANRVVFTISPPRTGADSDRILTLESISGAFLNRNKEGKKGFVMRNMTTTRFKSLPLKPTDGKPVQVPFDFFPEFKPQQLGVEFRLVVNDAQTGKKHNIHAYTGTVTVIEPKKSWFDAQLLSLYAIMAGIVLIAIQWASKQFPGSASINKRKDRQADAKALPKGTATSTRGQPMSTSTASSSSYDESWIPEHHLKSRSGASSPRPKSSRTNSSKK